MSEMPMTVCDLEPIAFVSQYALATMTNTGTGQYVARSRQLRRKADVALYSHADVEAATRFLRDALEAIAEGDDGIMSARDIARFALAGKAHT